jgi:oxygen-independent coproporphyrinogen-3 oxidase
MMKTSKYNRNKTSKAVGLYIHIPFCDKKCNYCDFLSFATTEGSSYREYVSTLIKEIHYYGKVYNNEYYVDTVFIGGGTPSLIPEAFVKEIMAAVSAAFHIAKDAEISIEANPGTLTKNKLNTYLRAGINRLSMGVQSLDNTLLKTLGRIHTAEEAIENYLMARDCGFDNINLDLMFALPGQTQEIWHNTLENALNLSPSHISFYSLQYEEGTPFFEGLKKGILEETSDGLYIEMYKTALAL